MKAWKIVDAEHAHLLAVGALKVGRLLDYQSLENGRGDPAEGKTLVIQDPAKPLDGENPAHREALARLGFNAAKGIFVGNVKMREVEPTYAFCMSVEGHYFDPTPEKPKVLFEISDVGLLAKLVQRRNPWRLADSAFSRVTYKRVWTEAMEQGDAAPSAFRKNVAFAAEREVRIAWLARRKMPYETIFTEPDQEIAALFRQL